jgi:HIV Tat-specific factor 1
MFVKVRDARMQWARSNKKSIAVSSNSSTTAQDDARMHDVKQGREISMRDVIYFYFSFLATTARVEDEKIDNTSNVSPRPENETDLEAKKGNKGPNSREGISVPLMLARAHRVDTKAKCTTGGVPNRWPLSIPYVAHNLYFIGNSNTACICLGLEISNKDFNKNDTKNHDLGVTLRVLPISLSSYQYQQNLSPPSIKALNDINLQQISDARLIDFLMAMKDFAEQELRENPECMWYTFPSFLTNLISQPNDWKAWRKQVEKAAAAASANLPRQQVYYQALISEKLKKNEDRVLHTSLPWDDSVYEVEVEPTFSPVAKALPPSGAAGEKRKRSDSSEELSKLKTKPNKSVCNIPSVTVEVLGQDVKSNSQAELNCKPLKVKEKEIKLTKKTTGGTQQPKGRKLKGKAVGPRSCSPPPPPPINMSNLWWLSKSSLPCIFYGHTGDEFKDSFVVKPICCTTFHYEIKVRIQEIDILTEDRLKLCTDDRTRDFACALLDFIEWETSRVKLSRKKSLSHESDIADESKADNVSTAGSWKPKTSGVSRLSVPYQWPDFVYDLIVYREKWNVWKKKVERSMRGNSKNGARRSAYLSTLIQNHLDLETERRMGIEEDASNGSECEVDSTGGGPDADDVEFDAHNGNNENELVSTTPGIEVQGARTGEHGDRGNDVSDGDTSRDEDDEDEDEDEEEEDEEEESFKTFIVRGSKHNESSSESNIIDSEEESKTITVDAEDTHKKCVPQYAKSSEIKIKSLSETNAIDNEEESSSDSMIDESEEYVGKVGGKTHAPENVYDIINYKDSRLGGKIIESAASSNVATTEMEKIEVISVSESVSGSEEDESSEESSEEGDGTSSNNPICMLISDGDDDEDDDDDDDDEEIPRHGLNINPRFKENGDGVRSSLFYRKGVREAIKDNDDYCHDQGPDSDSTRVKGPRNYGSR